MQLINTGVHVHMACPGFVNTTMIKAAQKEAVRGPSHPEHLPAQPSTAYIAIHSSTGGLCLVPGRAIY